VQPDLVALAARQRALAQNLASNGAPVFACLAMADEIEEYFQVRGFPVFVVK
jgi:hypothetical protein